jgi:hypothetical protein
VDELIELLRALARHEHSDVSIAEEAAAEIEALRTKVRERDASLGWWGRFASGAVNARKEAEARAERLEKTLGAYKVAVNKIDDRIEYALPMPPETKAALYAILADLTAALAQETTNGLR